MESPAGDYLVARFVHLYRVKDHSVARFVHLYHVGDHFVARSLWGTHSAHLLFSTIQLVACTKLLSARDVLLKISPGPMAEHFLFLHLSSVLPNRNGTSLSRVFS